MKLLLALLIFFNYFTAAATNYYFSSDGNDANTGTSTYNAWQTLNKFNSVFKSFVPGDSILFKRGDIFYGNLVITGSGIAQMPIIISSYGRGANPIISGFTNVTRWTKIGNNIWESTKAISKLSSCNMVVVNGLNTPMGRYPNTGYLTYQSHITNRSITSSSLNSSVTNWTGAEVVIKKLAWVTDRNKVISHTLHTLTYTSGSDNNGSDNWGFFLQNDVRTLDRQNEWYYNPSTRKIIIYSSILPTKIKISTIDTLVTIQSKSYIIFDGISFDGSNKDAFTISADHITIQNCSIDHSGQDGIWGAQNNAASNGFIFQNNIINHTNNNAINLRDYFSGALIQKNLIKNTGILEGMMTKIFNGNSAGIGIGIRADNVLIQYNEVDSSGYAGIAIFNNNDIVQYNFVNYFDLTLMDGGGIYVWVGVGNISKKGQKVLNNIVLNGIGKNAGTTNEGRALAHGIYLDDFASDVEILGNTAANCTYAGLFLHNTKNINIQNNTFYNNGTGVLFLSDNEINPITTTVFKHNIIVAKIQTQNVAYFDSHINEIKDFGIIDSNYWARLIDNRVIFKTLQKNQNQNLNLEQLRIYYGFDNSSIKVPKIVQNKNDVRFEYNPSSQQVVINLNAEYFNLDGKICSKKIILTPYSSIILIK